MSENGRQLTAENAFANFNANEMRQGIAVMGALMDRLQLGGVSGLQYGTERDLFKELGYPDQLTIDDFEAKYERDGLAGRIVDKPARDTWRRAPTIHDGDENGPDKATRFTDALGQLAKRVRLWKVLKDLDQEVGIGEYGVLLIGVKGEASFDEEVAGALNGPDDIIYLRPYRQSAADIVDHEEDKGNPRYGKPTLYDIDLGKVGDEDLGEMKVHWTRILHVAENSIDGVYGRPRMQRSFNRLMDQDKVVGSGAEAVWRLIYKGLIVSEKEGYEMPTDSGDLEDLEDEFLKLMHKFKRVVIAGGTDVEEVGTSETPDPSGIFGIIVDLIAADTGIPKRILLGSERGELASSTDEATWAGEIKNRQTSFAEPSILRPFVDWCLQRGALPEPANDEYTVEWHPLFEQSEAEMVDIGKARLEALGVAARDGIREFGLASGEEIRGQVGLPPEIEGESVDDMLDIEDEMGDEVVEEVA